MKQLTVYDNGGETIDRYTVIIDSNVYGMSDNPLSPNGFNQYCCDLAEIPGDLSHLGEDITKNYLGLPRPVFVAIHNRVNEET